MTDIADAKDARFQAWLDKVCARPMPSDKIARVKTFARELAEGATEEFWSANHLSQHVRLSPTDRLTRLSKDEMVSIEEILVSPNWVRGFRKAAYEAREDWHRNFLSYVLHRWDFECAKPALLRAYGFMNEGNILAKSAFDLLSESIPANIFISYHRKSSSALGLLIVARMKAVGMEPFIDMALVPGEAWNAGLQERIRSYDALILLLAPETLTSEYVVREIEWALEAGVEVIPLWHDTFAYKSEQWRDKIPAAVDEHLARTHAIRVLEESASGYNTAIVELLNHFGITPD